MFFLKFNFYIYNSVNIGSYLIYVYFIYLFTTYSKYLWNKYAKHYNNKIKYEGSPDPVSSATGRRKNWCTLKLDSVSSSEVSLRDAMRDGWSFSCKAISVTTF